MTETFLLIESNSVKENSFMALKHIAFGCAAVMAAAGAMAATSSFTVNGQTITKAQQEELIRVYTSRGQERTPQLETQVRHLLTRDMLLLQEARKVTGQPIVTELMNNEHIPLFLDAKVDMIQIGARNMQNFELLKAVGKLNVPVLLKRGLSSTLEELVMSAEYIMAEGNENVILCERGIRTFETSMRNTLDLAGVVMLHKMTHLPVVVDPSHATGHTYLVEPMAMAAAAAGADGIMIEVHNDPPHALCDGAQSLTPEEFKHTAGRILRIREAMKE